MAKRDRLDIALNNRFDEFEKRVFLLKMEYEKYFSGISNIEPLRERDDLKRMMRDLQQQHITSTRQKHRLRSLRARFSQMELYWQRNLVMVERGTHPKMKFRADLKEQKRTPTPEVRRPRAQTAAEKESAAYRAVYDKYMEARRTCGQTSDMGFDSVESVLKKQVRTIKSRYKCKAVKFRVTVEDGKAKVKAVPLR